MKPFQLVAQQTMLVTTRGHRLPVKGQSPVKGFSGFIQEERRESSHGSSSEDSECDELTFDNLQ